MLFKNAFKVIQGILKVPAIKFNMRIHVLAYPHQQPTQQAWLLICGLYRVIIKPVAHFAMLTYSKDAICQKVLRVPMNMHDSVVFNVNGRNPFTRQTVPILSS